jgi:hydrogenase maturation protease
LSCVFTNSSNFPSKVKTEPEKEIKTMNCHLAATLKTLRQSTLVIGYGNDLRGDDGVGQQVARTVEIWGVPNVRSLAVHQLTPELAAELATVDRVIFVDAYLASAAQDVQVCALEPAHCVATIGHTSDPQMLLAIAQALYNHHPEAWWVGIPAVNFELSDRLSPRTEQGMADALEEIDRLIRQQPLSIAQTSVALSSESRS